MIRLILKLIVTLLLIILPFLGGSLIGGYTPYTEGNSMTTFVAVYSVLTIIIGAILFFLTSRFKNHFLQPVQPGSILFFIGLVMLGIAGLAAPPDLSIKMLEYPEREHCRYIILYIGAVLFSVYFIQLFRYNLLALKPHAKWLMIVLFLISSLELFWEFLHHYNYPESLKTWIDNGNKAEDFSQHYDNDTIGSIGTIGRFAIYLLILWLSVRLYQIKRVNLWNPILSTFFGLLGILSSISMFLHFSYKIETPKELGFLIIFFIPGVPFLILYWIGVAMLTKKLFLKPEISKNE